jgi:hypothetical protein
MSQVGWIKLYRQITENELWEDKPFARGQAWIDLLMMADSQDGECFYNGKIQPTHIGEVRTSILYLSKRWGWSRHKVADFLNNLQGVHMIAQKRTSKSTTIFIKNYAEFAQKSKRQEQQKGQVKGIKRTSKGHQKDIHKNIKEYKEDKEEGATPQGSSEPSLDVPEWLDVGSDFENLSNDSKQIRIMYRKRDKLDELKRYAADMGILSDECDNLARECMDKHEAQTSWIDGLIRGEHK